MSAGRCVHCDRYVRRRDAAGLCWACWYTPSRRPPESEAQPSLEDDLAAARARALERQAAWLAELRERMARRRDLGIDEADERPRRKLGRAQGARREDPWT